MKFSCGWSEDSKLRRLKDETRRLKDWHKVFIIFPRTIGTDANGKSICAALQYVERKFYNAYVEEAGVWGPYIFKFLPEYRECVR